LLPGFAPKQQFLHAALHLSVVTIDNILGEK